MEREEMIMFIIAHIGQLNDKWLRCVYRSVINFL